MKMIEKEEHIYFQDERLTRHMAIIRNEMPNDDIVLHNYIGRVTNPENDEEDFDIFKLPNDNYIATPKKLLNTYRKRLNKIATDLYNLDPYVRDDEETIESTQYDLTHDYIKIIEYLLDIIENRG